MNRWWKRLINSEYALGLVLAGAIILCAWALQEAFK